MPVTPQTLDRPPFDAPQSHEKRRLALWHGGCAFAAVALALAGQFAGGFMDQSGGIAVKAALLMMAMPGLVGLWLLKSARHRDRVLLLGGWCLAATSASALSGGLTGPLAGLLVLPVSAGLLLGGWRWGLNGALAGLVSVGLAVLVGLASIKLAGPPPPTPILAAGSGLGGALAFAASLIWTWWPRERALGAAVSARDRAEALLEGLPGLTLVLSPTGRVLASHGRSPFASDILSLNIGEGEASGLIATVHAPDRPSVLTALDRAARSPEEAESLQVVFAPRRALDRRVILVLRRLDEGRLAALVLDGTAQFAREHGLETARAEAVARSDGKSRFLANMSHELRTPLNAVLGFSDIMRTRLFGPLPERYAEYADSIHQAGQHLLALINDVLDVSKIEADRYELAVERIDAREAVSAAVALVRLAATDKAVALSAVLPGEAVNVDADRRALQQITLNLLSNAIKFTPAAGSVTVTLEAVGPYLELVVSDTGVGIAPEDLQRLGRPFEQAGGVEQRAQGTGLGLSLVRSLAELHGGRMTIDSTLGEGTAVTVRLPVVAVQKALPLETGAKVIPLHAPTGEAI